MNKKYIYLFRKVGETKISSYFVPNNMLPVKLSDILNMLQKTHSSLKRFQICIQKEENGKKQIVWDPIIYNVCENKFDLYKPHKGEVVLDKNFNLMSISTSISQIIKQESILK